MQSESRYHYLNDVNYFFKYSEEVVATITNVIIPYVSQFEYYSDENHFNRIIQILLESDQTYEDIYYSLGVYLLSQTEEVEEKMNTVRTILYNLQRADEAVAQRVLNIMNVLIPQAAQADAVGDAVSQQELQQMQDFKRIVPDEELAKLQVVAFSDLQTDEKNCSICLDEFLAESQLYTIPCKHLFHKECLEDWVAENYKCPVCRGEIAKYKVDFAEPFAEQNDEPIAEPFAEHNIEENFEERVPDIQEDHGDFVLHVYNVDENNVIYNIVINDEALGREDEDEVEDEEEDAYEQPASEAFHEQLACEAREHDQENASEDPHEQPKYCVIDRSHGLAMHFCQQCNMHLCTECDTDGHMYANMRYHQRVQIELESEDEDDGDVIEKENVEENEKEIEEENEEEFTENTENEEK
jgi:Ring finger domain